MIYKNEIQFILDTIDYPAVCGNVFLVIQLLTKEVLSVQAYMQIKWGHELWLVQKELLRARTMPKAQNIR